MDNPREDTSHEHYLTRGAFTVAAVRADTETKGLEAALASANAELKIKGREIEDLDETLQEQDARITVRDRAVDKQVRSFELRLLDLVDKNRDDPRYRRYFAHGLRAVTEADARQAEPKLVRTMIKTLDEDQSKSGFESFYAEFGVKMLSAVEAVEVADAACRQIEEQIEFAREKVMASLKLKWIEERKKLHAELSKMFPHDPARVESYFRRFAKARSSRKPE